MAAREEIREGMAKYILVCGNKPDVYTPDMCAEDLMEYLHSQGVVIKKNNIKYVTAHRDGNAFITTVAVEPLVKE